MNHDIVKINQEFFVLDNLIQNTEITPHKIHSLKELAISAPQDDIKMSALQTLINTVKSAKTIEVKKEVILALRGILVSLPADSAKERLASSGSAVLPPTMQPVGRTGGAFAGDVRRAGSIWRADEDADHSNWHSGRRLAGREQRRVSRPARHPPRSTSAGIRGASGLREEHRVSPALQPDKSR